MGLVSAAQYVLIHYHSISLNLVADALHFSVPIPPDIRVMMRTIATMARMKRWWWKVY